MPRENIDYSNTIIYKIYCKDENIKDIYVGHTTSFIKRKYQHKTCCNNLSNKVKIYETIRHNGGWENWDMVEIAKYNCKDSTEARIKEQEYYELLKANLNSVPPFVNKYDYYCDICNYQFDNEKSFSNHNNCKHVKPYQETNINNDSSNYHCEYCDFKCNKNSDWDRHIITTKHNNNVISITRKYNCNCGKNYIHRQSLFNHKKICNFSQTLDIQSLNQEVNKDQIINVLLKQNQELKELLIEQNNKMFEMYKEKMN